MATKRLLKESELAGLAKQYRVKSGLGKTQAAAELGVSRTTMHLAEEAPDESLTKLRCRIIKKYSPYKVVGPLYLLQKK